MTHYDLEKDGFTHLHGVIDMETIHRLRAALEGYADHAPVNGEYGILCANLWRALPEFAALIDDGRLAQAVMKARGWDEVLNFQDNLIWKTPETTSPIAWHQDYSYWPLDRHDGVMAWLALDDAGPESGCLYYIPGTHTLGERQAASFVAGDTPDPNLPPLAWEALADQAVPVIARPGDLLVHSPMTWHMSPACVTPRHRRGYATAWITPQTRWAPDHGPHPYKWELNPQHGALVEGPLFRHFTRAE